ncbi:MAG TPA: HDIG domain-containing protein [Nitrospirae bacterium]|nr:HDIG domain-containing protein [Nitrospirota bacterium]
MKKKLMKIDLDKKFKNIHIFVNSIKLYLSKQYILFVTLLGISLLSAFIMYDGHGINKFAGIFFVSVIILYVFCKDVMRYKPLYIRNPKMLFLLGLIFIGSLGIIKLFSVLLDALTRGLDLGDGLSYIYGIPVPIGAVLITLVFDFHTAIFFSFIISIILGLWLGNPSYILFAFVGSITGAFCVIRCKKRTVFVKAGLYVSLINIVTSFISFLFITEVISERIIINTLIFSIFSGLVVASITSILLPIIEYFFSVTTDISLLELLDLDHPLMKNLMISAPGTYHHSIIVGNLAETAAEAVGANPLLAKVAAYYHDIGKTKIPEYFVENQTDSVNKHDKLSPHMSSMILISHVKEGIELAKQHKMPSAVIEIIQQHHGTSLITYFYQKALEQGDTLTLSKENFRYPGPKPQTRVAAIVMMADAVEAASRTLIEPIPSRISALVERIINNIFLDGQIDECELTLRDMSEIKKKFTYILTSIFHKRIQYPETVKALSNEKA